MAAKVESLTLRKLADQTAERQKLFDPFTGQSILVTPENYEEVVTGLLEAMSAVVPTPRPFLGIQIEGKAPPKRTRLSTSFVANAKAEGWIEVEDEDLVVRSSGPPEDPFGPRPHAFLHYSAITIKTVDGDLRYKVVENPDKWPDEKEGNAGFGGEVRHFYLLELEG